MAHLSKVATTGIIVALLAAAMPEHADSVVATAAAQSTPVADLSVAEQDALAERYRANFLRELSPDDWYRCYTEAKIGDYAGPMFDALRAAKISEAKLKPLLQREVFNRFVINFLLKHETPQLQYASCNTSKSSPPSAPARGSFVQGLSKILGAALRMLGAGDVAFMAGRIRDDAVDDSPPSRTDQETEAIAQNGLRTATSLVAAYLGDAGAATFAADPPRVKAQKLAVAARALTLGREWPNAFFLIVADGGGRGGGYYILLQHYGNPNHPDVVNWHTASDYQRGEMLRRMYAESMLGHADIAAGKESLEVYLLAHSQSQRFDTNRFIGEAFGLDMLKRYREAEAHGNAATLGYSADDIRVAAYVYTMAMRQVIVMSL